MPARGTKAPKRMELLERAYESAFEPVPFASLLPRLAEAVGADAAHINMWAPELDAGELAIGHDMPEHLVRVYREHFWRVDLWRLAMERMRIPIGRAFAGHAIVPYATLLQSEMYNDALRGYGIFETCGGQIFAQGNAGGGISLMRARGRRFYGAREVARLGTVLPHMARAMNLRLRLEGLRSQRDAFGDFIESLAGGALLVRRDGRVSHATTKARILLDDPAGPLRLKSGRLHARHAAADRQVQRLFANGNADVPWPSDGTAIDLPPRHWLRVIATARAAGLLSLAHAAYVLVVEKSRPAEASAEAAAARYGLTRAETELLCALVAGRSLAEAARLLSRSYNTVRNQLQSLLAKSHAHRQSELIAKVLTLRAN